jgi:hypothetical protein
MWSRDAWLGHRLQRPARHGPRAAAPCGNTRGEVTIVTYLKDLGWLLLIVVLLPLWMGLGLAAIVFVSVKQLYLWVRGNTTSLSRIDDQV